MFAVVFAANACGIVTMGQLSARIVTRHGPERLLAASGSVGLVAAVALAVVVLAGGGLASLLPPLLVFVACWGMVVPNASALALRDHPAYAGSASALLNLSQYALGALAAPLVGLAGERSAVPMALVILGGAGGSALAVRGLTTLRGHPVRAR